MGQVNTESQRAWKSPVPEFIDPVFVKTSPKRSFSVIQNERFGLVFVKTGSIISGTGVKLSVIAQSQGWERNFVPKKFRGIDSERFPLFRGRKCSFQGLPSSAEEPIPQLGTEQNGTEFREKIKFYVTCTARSTYIHRVPQCMSSRRHWDSPNPSPASGRAPL